MVKTLTLLSSQENQKVDALIKGAENELIIFTQESQYSNYQTHEVNI